VSTLPPYRHIADDLRAAIAAGEYPQGSKLPRVVDLVARYGVSRQTVRSAIGVLEAEGLVQAITSRGTVVRPRPERRRIVRHRGAFRDELGYFFSDDAAGWRELRPSVVEYRPAPADIAEVLGIEVGDEVLVRDRLVGDREQPARRQATTSYLPADITRGTMLEQPQTGPGGIYDRLEWDMGHGPLSWAEQIQGRAPTGRDVDELALPPGVVVLRVLRVTTSAAGRVVEVNDTRVSGELFVVSYTLERDEGARWPVAPASVVPTAAGDVPASEIPAK
jgi:DNA-binding GntR family transcriptional regulator